ncbi:Kelch domain-containing protein 4 [Babesia caballi]|uniref:Kelch domain-containing protein 4 n=1 Tax=Babesia caballi TaxID=5871 RepID=A0AAV4LLI4_BABCB|nr:Kelch domain-containing protein 4 [Babesia caballi]
MELALQTDVLVWEKISTKGKPTYSIGFGVSSYKTCGVAFGGVADLDSGGTSLKSTFYNNCYIVNLEHKRWYPLTANQTAAPAEAGDAGDKLAGKLASTESRARVEKMGGVSLTTAPQPRMNPHVVVCGNSLFVYGGIVEQGSVEMTLSDLWVIDLGKRDGWKCLDAGFNFREIYKGEIDMQEDSSSDEESERSEENMNSGESEEDEDDGEDEDMMTDEESSEG